MKEVITLPIFGQFVVFEELQKGDNLLFFYDRDLEARRIFESSLFSGLKNGHTCFCAFDSSNPWPDVREEDKDKVITLPLSGIKQKGTYTLEGLWDEIRSIEKYAKKDVTEFRLLIDFGELVGRNNLNIAVECEGEIIRKNKELKRRYTLHKSTYKNNCYISSVVTAFNITSLDVDTIKQLLNMPKKIVVFLKDFPKMLKNFPNVILPNFVIDRQLSPSSLDTISQKSMEKFVKNNIEMIILHMLKDKPMSGYEIIKNISSKFHVYLNQGNVYPLLYSLKTKGVLNVKLGYDNRTKFYSIAKEDALKRLDEFVKIVNHFACLNV